MHDISFKANGLMILIMLAKLGIASSNRGRIISGDFWWAVVQSCDHSTTCRKPGPDFLIAYLRISGTGQLELVKRV